MNVIESVNKEIPIPTEDMKKKYRQKFFYSDVEHNMEMVRTKDLIDVFNDIFYLLDYLLDEKNNHICKCNCKPVNSLVHEDLKNNFEYNTLLATNEAVINEMQELKEYINNIDEKNSNCKNTKIFQCKRIDCIYKVEIENTYCENCEEFYKKFDGSDDEYEDFLSSDEIDEIKAKHHDDFKETKSFDSNINDNNNDFFKDINEQYKDFDDQIENIISEDKKRKKYVERDNEEIKYNIKNKLENYSKKIYSEDKIKLNRDVIKLYAKIYEYIDNINKEELDENLIINIGKNKSRLKKLCLICSKIRKNDIIFNSTIYIPIYIFQDIKIKDKDMFSIDEIINYLELLIQN